MGRRVNGHGSIWRDETRSRWVGRVTIHGETVHLTGKTKREVEAGIAAARSRLAPTGYTVSRAAEEWMRVHVIPLCRRSTREQYRYLLDKWLLPNIGETLVEVVTPRDIQSVIATMHEAGLSSKTMAHARTTLHALFAWLELNRITSNPVRKIRIPQTDNRKRRSLSQHEVAVMLHALEQSRWIHSVRFLLLTGLRRGELLALRWTDIRDGWIHIHATRDKDGTEGPPKSKAGIRRIPLGKSLQGILEAQRAMLALEMVLSEYVFPSHTGQPVMPGTYYTSIRRIAAKHGVHVSVHELRHTFVTLAGRGVDIQALQQMLGHATATQTLDLYQHLTAEVLEQAANAVDSRASFIFEGSTKVSSFTEHLPEHLPGQKSGSG